MSETLAVLERLRATLREFCAREARLNRDWSAESAKLRQQFEQASAELEAQVTAELAQRQAAFAAERQKLDLAHERRKSHIHQAYQQFKQRRLEEIEADDGRRKFEIQRDLLQTERDRESFLKAADAAFAALTDALAAEQQRLALMEQHAQTGLRGYRKFLRLLARPPAAAPSDAALSPHQLLEALRARLGEADRLLLRSRWMPGPLVFRFLPLWLWVIVVVLAGTALVPLLRHFGKTSIGHAEAGGAAAGGLALVFALHFLGGRHAVPAATGIATALGQARELCDRCRDQSLAWHQQETDRIRQESESCTAQLQERWKENSRHSAAQRAECGLKADLRAKSLLDANDRRRQARLDELEQRRVGCVAHLEQVAAAKRRALENSRAERERQGAENFQNLWQVLTTEWQAQVAPLYAGIAARNATAEQLCPPWGSPPLQQWTPRPEFAHAVRFASLDVDLSQFAGALPRDARLALPGPAHFRLPLLLSVPDQASVLFETKTTGCEAVGGALNNIILRLLSVAPPGRVNFTILDPVELGQSFAGIMHLADYEERLINSRIWTQTSQIEEQLARLGEHIEKVTQMYLRNEYQTIAEYNAQAGRIAERYHFLVVADFPVNFSELAAKRLLSIAASGARCGVYTLIHWDRRRPAPLEFVPDELRKNSVCLVAKDDGFTLGESSLAGTVLRLDSPPSAELATQFLHQVGRRSVDSNRVEMPFGEVAPAETELWSLETTAELRVPIGRTGATKLQYLALGKGTRQHALIAGKTGSGKSTLFHVIITNLSLWCSPAQVEFYLVDFKKGVEFKCYATHRLPHARVVAIESDREFGLSVLQRVDEELKRRGEMFRRLEVQDLAGYKKAGGTEPMPRTLLLIDEFQEFFVEDDRISQNAALLLDRLVRQGRAFGIHVLLGSQTLGGAYTLARATLGQMVVRIALQCNEADAYLIMDESNAAPRLLSRPGEAIYNDTAGTIEGNSPFQIVWLPDEAREACLAEVSRRVSEAAQPQPGPIVFEGNAPAHVEENPVLQRLLEADSVKPTPAPRVWLGAPNSIKGPTEVVFRRQSGNHLLMVGQRDEAILGLLAVSLVSLAVQHRRGAARFILLDPHPADSPQRRLLGQIVKAIPHEIILATNTNAAAIMTRLTEDLEKRSEQGQAAAPETYLLLHELQKFKKLRYEEDFGFSLGDAHKAPPPGLLLNQLICEGASLGFHVLCTCDTVNNVNRCLSRKALSEFELRVLFQMSANDSATLIDSPKANDLGLHRAIFFNQQEGYLETFRPYAPPRPEWIEHAARHLARLLG